MHAERRSDWRRLAAAAALLLIGLGCRAPRPSGGEDASARPPAVAEDAEVARIRAMLDELYRAFCFDAGGEPDWDAMRARFAGGAAFYAPARPGGTPRGVDAERFFADFAAYVASEPVRSTGLHERILHARVDAFGGVAHAFVAFEGFAPGADEASTRGLDAIALVRDGERWLVASFATQYEGRGLALPARFTEPRADGAR